MLTAGDCPRDEKSWLEARTKEIDDELQRIDSQNRTVADAERIEAPEHALSPEGQNLFDRLYKMIAKLDQTKDLDAARLEAKERALEESNSAMSGWKRK